METKLTDERDMSFIKFYCKSFLIAHLFKPWSQFTMHLMYCANNIIHERLQFRYVYHDNMLL